MLDIIIQKINKRYDNFTRQLQALYGTETVPELPTNISTVTRGSK